MSIFAIADLHLSGHRPKPMDIFGRKMDRPLDKDTASVAQHRLPRGYGADSW